MHTTTQTAAGRVASWFISKARAQAQTSGYYRAAVNLRKQGVPLELARLMLLGRW
jgi:hypothetical protein